MAEKWNQTVKTMAIAVVFLLVAMSGVSLADETICAKVKIEIRQELTLERQAFDAHMRINNGLTHVSLEDVDIDVTFSDEEGNTVLASSDPDNTDALFFIRVDSMDNISDINGAGTVSPDTSADIHWLIIPAQGASNDVPSGTLYYVGATLTYTLGGEEHVTVVTPDYIFVKPMPDLTLDYFLPVDVYGDDPLTGEIEPTVPFYLGVRVKNNGAGTAHDLKIDSAQPKIVENELGLLINFVIEGSTVNGKEITPSLLVDFGDILPGTSGTARWVMTCSLSGEFTEFTAEFSHSDELGGELTSLIEAVQTHFLVRDVLVDLPGRDSVKDFLARDGGSLMVYESESTESDVADLSSSTELQQMGSSGGDVEYRLTMPVTQGFGYAKVADPFNGEKVIKYAVRSDGKRISTENVWLSKSKNEAKEWEYFLNLFDVNSMDYYTIWFEDITATPQPPVLQFIPDKQTAEGAQVSFLVEASDPNGTIPKLSTNQLPSGAQFIDNGDGTGFFDWIPSPGQAGTYTIKFIASDGALKAFRYMTIKVCSPYDTDCDGMDDEWEMEHFGTLDRDGTGDYDGDGISDLDEFLNGTPPAEFVINITRGFNLISITEDTSLLPDIGNWLPVIGSSSEVEKVMAYDVQAQNFVSFIPESVENQEYTLRNGEGLIVYSFQDKEVGLTSVHCMSIDLEQGFNFTGFACAPDGYSAYQLLSDLGSANILNVQKYNFETGTFETAGFDAEGNIIGVDFPIVPGEGYFVYMSAAVERFQP